MLLALFTLLAACAEGEGGDASATSGGGSGASSTTGESCASGTACDGRCVDLDADPMNCGACGRTCVVLQAAAACEAGECALGACEVGWADCDGDLATGCEHAKSCQEGQACATACGTQGALSCADVCAPSCALPAEACNAADDDCDAECDEGPVAGCRKPVHRAYSPTKGHYYSDDAAEASMPDYTLEAAGYFHLYADATADLRPLFRCPKGDGSRFLSTSNDCEVTGPPEKTVGFIAPEARCGSTPLFRLRHTVSGHHFYTVDAGERDNAIAMYGYADEGLAGHVWAGP